MCTGLMMFFNIHAVYCFGLNLSLSDFVEYLSGTFLFYDHCLVAIFLLILLVLYIG